MYIYIHTYTQKEKEILYIFLSNNCIEMKNSKFKFDYCMQKNYFSVLWLTR